MNPLREIVLQTLDWLVVVRVEIAKLLPERKTDGIETGGIELPAKVQ